MSTGQVSESFIQILLHELNVKYIVMDQSIQSELYRQLDVRPYKLTFANWTKILPVNRFGDLVVYENTRFGSIISIPSKWINVSSLDLLPYRFSHTSVNPGFSAFVVGNDSNPREHLSNATLESITQISPTAFDVRLHASGIFLLALSTAFDNRWQATAEGGTLNNHLIIDGYANGWIVSGSGEMLIRIDYGPQVSYQISLLISFGVVLLVLTVLGSWQVRAFR